MSWVIRISLALLITFLSGCAGSTSSVRRTGEDARYQVPKQIRYSFTVSNTTNQLLEKAEFWTYLPVPQTSHQKVEKITANYPYRETRDELGNSSIHFELKDIPPYGVRIVSITVDMLMSPQPIPMSVADRALFTSREPYIEIDDSRISALAAQLHNTSVPMMVQQDYDWVAKNLTSEGYVAEDRGAAYAISERKGDCTEYAYLLTALYRAQQIPARAVGGYVFSGNGVMKAMDYHNWTEFYLNGAWQIADAQKGNFVSRQGDYVAMRVISTGGRAAVASQRFSFAGNGLRVEMN